MLMNDCKDSTIDWEVEETPILYGTLKRNDFFVLYHPAIGGTVFRKEARSGKGGSCCVHDEVMDKSSYWVSIPAKTKIFKAKRST